MSIVDLISKFNKFFTLGLGLFVQQTVLLVKSRDFRAFQRILGFLSRITDSILKKLLFYSYMRLICPLHIDLFYLFLCQSEAFIF